MEAKFLAFLGGLAIADIAPRVSGALTLIAGAAGFLGLSARYIVDWRFRSSRDPDFLAELSEKERRYVEDLHSQALWRATLAGSAAGVLLAALVLIGDAV